VGSAIITIARRHTEVIKAYRPRRNKSYAVFSRSR
jgi:hypothetical protein